MGKKLPDFSPVLPHFTYLPGDCGIRISTGNEFVIQTDSSNENVLFPIDIFFSVLDDENMCTSKYLLGVSTQ